MVGVVTILYIICYFVRNQLNNLESNPVNLFQSLSQTGNEPVTVKLIVKDIKTDFQLHINANLSAVYCCSC